MIEKNEPVVARIPTEESRRTERMINAGYKPNRLERIRKAILRYVDNASEVPEAVDALKNAYLIDKPLFRELLTPSGLKSLLKYKE